MDIVARAQAQTHTRTTILATLRYVYFSPQFPKIEGSSRMKIKINAHMHQKMRANEKNIDSYLHLLERKMKRKREKKIKRNEMSWARAMHIIS